MLWSEFKNAVRELITVDADRMGIEAFVDRQIGIACGELQYFIEFYRQGNETTFDWDDAIDDGYASVITLPSGMFLREIYHTKVGNKCVRRSLYKYDYHNRYDLTCGIVGVGCSGGNFRYVLNPQANKMWIYPRLMRGYRVEIVWDGKITKYEDDAVVPFDDTCALAVAEFVKAKVAREVDRDVKLAADYMRSYSELRSHLYIEVAEKQRMESKASEARCGGSDEGASGCCGTCGGGLCGDQTQLNPCDCQPVISIIDLAGYTTGCCKTIVQPETEWVMVGESGDTTPRNGTLAVATAVAAVNPGFLIHNGDANFPSGDPTTIGANFVNPYYGFLKDDAYAAFGAVDLATGYGASLLAALPVVGAILTTSGNSSTQLYYQFALGPVRFFVLNSGTSDSDSTANFSAQEAWLVTQFNAAGEPWKVVVTGRPLYSSGADATVCAQFRATVASLNPDLVVSGGSKTYERLLVSGVSYIVNGLGGAVPSTFNSPVAGSQVRINSSFGFLQFNAENNVSTSTYSEPSKLQVALLDTNGNKLDSLLLTK